MEVGESYVGWEDGLCLPPNISGSRQTLCSIKDDSLMSKKSSSHTQVGQYLCAYKVGPIHKTWYNNVLQGDNTVQFINGKKN